MSDLNYIKNGTLLGFTFDNTHSSTLGIVRIGNGSGFDEDLLPSISDYTVDAPGVDGTYYYGAKFTSRDISINFAFKGITDTHLRAILTMFNDTKLHYLTLDETPYKSYKVSVKHPPQISYNILTDEYEQKSFTLYGSCQSLAKNRLYYGTGTIIFTAHNPIAVSRIFNNVKYKYSDQFEKTDQFTPALPEWKDGNGLFSYSYYNYLEWKDSIALHTRAYNNVNLDEYCPPSGGSSGFFYVYNPGDKSTPFTLDYHLSTTPLGEAPASAPIICNDKNLTLAGEFSLEPNDDGIRINNNLKLIEGIDQSGKVTGSIYNRIIKSGDFFEIPITQSPAIMTVTMPKGFIGSTPTIDYGYRFY